MNKVILGTEALAKVRTLFGYEPIGGQQELKAIFNENEWYIECTGIYLKDDEAFSAIINNFIKNDSACIKIENFLTGFENYNFKVKSIDVNASMDEIVTYKIIIKK
jgi:predicted secreted protein